MPTRIDAEIGLDAKKFISGLAQASAAWDAFKSKADLSGNSLSISIRKASDAATKGAREIKTEFSNSADEISESLRRSGTLSENWANSLSQDAMDASKAFSRTADRVSTSIERASNSLKRGFGVGIIAPSMYADLRKLDRNLKTISLTATQAGNNVSSSADRMARSTKRLSGAQTGLQKSTRGTSAGMIEFSRLVGDAPYGIRGMANNLQQMAFVMGASGGVVFAITAATAALDYFFGGMKKSEKAVKGFSDTLDGLIGKSLSLSNALVSSQIEVQKNVAETEAYVRILNEAEVGTDQHANALQGLIDKFPDHEKAIRSAGSNVASLAAVYETLKEQIFAVGDAQAVFNSYVDARKEMIALQEKQQRLNEKEIEQAKDLNTPFLAIDPLNKGLAEGPLGVQQLTNAVKELINAGEGIGDLFQVGSIRKDRKEVNAEIDRVRARIENLKNELDTTDVGILFKAIGGVIGDGPVSAIREQVSAINTELKGIGQVTGIATNLQASIVSGAQGAIGIVRDQGVQLANAFNEGFTEILESGLEDTFGAMAAAIGEAIATGGNVVQAAGGALLGAVGGILVNLGKMAIGVGIGIKAIQKALLTLNPFVAIGAGVALIAIGSAFASGAKKLAGNMGGGGGGASSGSAAGSGTTTITSANTSGIQGTVVFEIAGRSLVGILKREAIHGNRITP